MRTRFSIAWVSLALVTKSHKTSDFESGIDLTTAIGRHARQKLTILSGPAAWGRTSLLAEWASGTAISVSYTKGSQLETDADPARIYPG